MNKSELIAALAADSGLTRKDAEKALNSFVTVVTNALKEDDKVQIVGFGTFEAKERPEHMGRNPRTGEPMTVAACKAPSFKVGKALKDAIK